MQAYEFYAIPENGVIRIPDEYKYKITDKVKVIVLEEEILNFKREETNARLKSDMLLPPTLDTRGWKFNREEANER